MGGSTRSTVTGAPDARSTATSAVTSVVVHSSGAVCTRLAHLDPTLRDGVATVRVVGLPPTLFEHSLRGRVVTGPPGLRVADVRLDVGATLRRGAELPSQRLDLEDAEDLRSRLRDRRDRLTAEIAEVAAFRAEPPVPRRGDAHRWAPVESILALAGFIDSRLTVLHQRLRAAEDELARADHEVDVLRHRLDEASSALGTDRVVPTVSAILTLVLDDTQVEADTQAEADAQADADGDTGTADRDAGPSGEDGERLEQDGPAGADAANSGEDSGDRGDPAGGGAEGGAVAVELEYHVPGAVWTPVYQLRLDGRTGAGTLVLRAGVAQRTGEDWTGVRLGLSTADLLRRADLPELRSLRIGRSQEEPAKASWREPPAGLEELFAGYDAAALPPPTPQSAARSHSRSPSHSSRMVQQLGVETDGGPPFPSSVPAPAPAAPGGPPPEVEQFGYGAAAGESLAAGASAGAAPPAGTTPQRRKAGARTFGPQQRSAAPGGSRSDAPPAEPFLSADLLDYARLTMTGPDTPEGRGTLRPGSTGTPALVKKYRLWAGVVARLDRPAHAVDVRVSAGSFDYRFDTAAPVDVEADGMWHTVPVSEVPVSTEFAYVSVPSVDQSVFGTVLVTNTSSHALLAGPVDVMVDGDFVLTAALPTLAPGQRQAVGLGVAESVRVVRRAHMRESTAGMRGGTTVLDHTVEVEVANRLPYPVVVEVRERVPVSMDKDVRIEEHTARPPWSEPGEPLDGRPESYVRGARIWRVALEPGRTATLTGGFEIRFPVGKAAVGGNRRN